MNEQPRISDELKKMEHEPLAPAEKWMIGISLLLGVVLLLAFLLLTGGGH